MWANYQLARLSKDPRKIERAKQNLANYLAERIGKPPGMSLSAVKQEYEKVVARSDRIDTRTWVRVALVFTILIPPIIVVFCMMLGKKRNG